MNVQVKLAIQKNLLKEFGNSPRTVYMDDGDEFQIKLINPENFTVGVKIRINNELMSNNFIVLRPGECIWLERYVDTSRKLRFETYEVENNKTARNAIRDNGIVTVEFYKEAKNYYDALWQYPNTVYVNHVTYNDKTYDYPYTVTCDAATSLTSAASYATKLSCSCNGDAANSVCGTVETGRIGEGGVSDQQFESVNKTFAFSAYHTETVKILPKSQKPITSGDLHKVYCHECGRKIKSKFKYCPFCGAKQ